MGLLDILFGKRKVQDSNVVNSGSIITDLSGNSFGSSLFVSDYYKIPLVRAIVHKYANTVSKGEPMVKNMKSNYANRYQTILSARPNEFMTKSQFLYRLATIFKMENNAFIVPLYNKYGQINGMYPVSPNHAELREHAGKRYVVFTYANGSKMSMEYEKVGHLKSMYYTKDFFGEDNKAFASTGNLVEAQEASSTNALQSNSNLRFMGKLNSQVIDDQDMREQQEFIQKLNLNNNKSGMFIYDNRYESMEMIDSKPILLDANQKKAIENAVFNYWGGNQDILQSTYTENQWNAYFESEIEPFFIQLEEVLTNMLYDISQQMNGNGIKISSDHLRYANNETKITMAKEFFDRGMVTTNGALEIVDMPPISNGDIRYIRAEYVNAETGQPVRDNIGKEVDNDNGSETTVNGNDSDSGGGSSE